MRNLLASFILVLAACSSTPQASDLPQPLYQDGLSFSFPCPEHGSHLQTIKGHSIGVIYSIEDDQGNIQEVPEFIVTEVFQTLGIDPNGQQTPANQIPSPTGR